MPQIKEHDYPEFLRYLTKNGVGITRERVKANQLKPIQKEFSDKGVLKALLLRKNEKPVIASSDNYIIDGHHRWLGAVNTRADVSVIRASIPVKELLKLVHAFPKTYYKDIYDIAPVETPRPEDDPAVKESASAGATSSGAIASVANPPRSIKRKKNGAPEAPQLKNPDGTVKNALDVNTNVLGSNAVKR
jgi:hypothetical protein